MRGPREREPRGTSRVAHALSFREPRHDSILSEAPAPLNRVPSRALTLSSFRPQEHAIDGDSPLLAALGATMNPDGTLSGPGSKAGGPPLRQQLEMVLEATPT